jgi:hypothetical protein
MTGSVSKRAMLPVLLLSALALAAAPASSQIPLDEIIVSWRTPWWYIRLLLPVSILLGGLLLMSIAARRSSRSSIRFMAAVSGAVGVAALFTMIRLVFGGIDTEPRDVVELILGGGAMGACLALWSGRVR